MSFHEKSKKTELYTAILACVLCVIAPFSSDIYTPSLPAITIAFNSVPSSIQATVMSYFFAAAISQLIYGPLSEKYGRRIMVIIGLSICVFGTLFCALSQSAAVLITARFIQGFGAGACNGLFRAILRDSFSGAKLAKVASFMGIIYPVIFGVSPMLGGYIQEIAGWRYSFAFAVVVISIALLSIIFYLPETNLYRHTVTLKVSTILRQYFQLFTHPVFIGYTLLSSFSFAGFLCFYAVGPFIFENEMGITPSGFGWITVIVEAGLLVAQFINSQTVVKHGIHYMLGWGVILMVISGISLLVLSFLHIHQPWTIIAPAVLYSASAGFVFANAMAGAFEPFGHIAGIAAAVYGFLQMTVSALLGLVMTHLPETTPIPLAIVFTACGFVSMLIFYALKREH